MTTQRAEASRTNVDEQWLPFGTGLPDSRLDTDPRSRFATEAPEHRACRSTTFDERRGARQAAERRLPDHQLHHLRAHPDFEYATTEGQRKQWEDADTPPEGDGWVRNVHAGRGGWERFDYTEESYWMRHTPTVDNPVDSRRGESQRD